MVKQPAEPLFSFNTSATFEDQIRFLIRNLHLTIKDNGIPFLLDSLYNSTQEFTQPLQSTYPYLQEADLKKLSDHIRLKYYVYPFNAVETGTVGIDIEKIKLPMNRFMWQTSFWESNDLEIGPGCAVFRKGSQRLAVNSGFWTADGRRQVATGDSEDFVHTVFHPVFGGDQQEEGFQFIMGETLEERDSRQTLRFYLNFKPNRSIIGEFIQDVQQSLGQRKVAYNIKVLSNGRDFYRSDSVILYAEQKNFFIIRDFLQKVYKKYKSSLRKPVPLFTYPLADGLSFGEEPDSPIAQSLGQHRSKMLAAVLAKLALDNVDEEAREDIAIALLLESEKFKLHPKGIEAFHLNPASNFPYDPLTFSFIQKKEIVIKDIFLKAAFELGLFLCTEAIWLDETTCNWLAYHPETDPKAVVKGKPITSYRFLDDSLLNGRLGVKLFLTQLQNALEISDTMIDKTLKGLKQVRDTQWNRKYTTDENRDNSITPTHYIHQIQSELYQFESKKAGKLPEERTLHFWLTNKKVKDIALDTVDETTFEEIWKGALIKRWIEDKNIELAGSIIKTHFDGKNRPLKNGFSTFNTDLFTPTIRRGYAGIGYFLLRVYNPQTIPPLTIPIDD